MINVPLFFAEGLLLTTAKKNPILKVATFVASRCIMRPAKTVGKREFIQHTSKYLKLVEEQGEELIITHQNKPDLILSKIKKKTFIELQGLTEIKVHGDINEPILPGYDEW
jgi:hypothetical protein